MACGLRFLENGICGNFTCLLADQAGKLPKTRLRRHFALTAILKVPPPSDLISTPLFLICPKLPKFRRTIALHEQ
jgi:hypothetical protein